MTDRTTAYHNAWIPIGTNVALAERVVRHVLTYPERHDQNVWVDTSHENELLSIAHTGWDPAQGELDAVVCPTTACLGGWTLYLAGGDDPETCARSLVTGIQKIVRSRGDEETFSGLAGRDWAALAADALGVPSVDEPHGVEARRELGGVLLIVDPVPHMRYHLPGDTDTDDTDDTDTLNVIVYASLETNRRAVAEFAELFGLDFDAIADDVERERQESLRQALRPLRDTDVESV